MNVSSQISSIDESNSSGYFVFNGTDTENHSETSTFLNIISILLNFPINSYVIWLIVRGTGNGLAAEIFIFNVSVCEILICVSSLLEFLTLYFQISWLLKAFFDGLTFGGRPLFQCLICVERYLAVVHPVTFLMYKPLRYRLMFSAVAWVTCFASCIFLFILQFFLLIQLFNISLFVHLLLFLSIQMFCCLAVLRALKQSGPGERGIEREEENNMKRRAFHLILITTVTMAIIYGAYLILSAYKPDTESMQMYIIQISFYLAGVVQAVFYLYRVGKLNFMKCQ